MFFFIFDILYLKNAKKISKFRQTNKFKIYQKKKQIKKLNLIQ